MAYRFSIRAFSLAGHIAYALFVVLLCFIHSGGPYTHLGWQRILFYSIPALAALNYAVAIGYQLRPQEGLIGEGLHGVNRPHILSITALVAIYIVITIGDIGYNGLVLFVLSIPLIIYSVTRAIASDNKELMAIYEGRYGALDGRSLALALKRADLAFFLFVSGVAYVYYEYLGSDLSGLFFVLVASYMVVAGIANRVLVERRHHSPFRVVLDTVLAFFLCWYFVRSANRAYPSEVRITFVTRYIQFPGMVYIVALLLELRGLNRQESNDALEEG